MSESVKPLRVGPRAPTLLFVDHEVPQYDLYAGCRTSFMYLGLLVRMGFEVKLLCCKFERVEPYTSELNAMGIDALVGDWFHDHWESWLEHHGPGIDFVFFNKPEATGKFLPAIRRHTRAALFYQCHDLHHLRLRRQAELEDSPELFAEAARWEAIENRIFAGVDAILTFSSVERTAIEKAAPQMPVITVPLFFYAAPADAAADFESRRDLLFVGSCAHAPNRDAIKWFCTEILPRVHQYIPGVKFNAVSAGAPDSIQALGSEHVKIMGRVSDHELNRLYDRTRIVVVPLRYGAGVKGKVIEALHHGVPIVSTSIGVEGIPDIESIIAPQDSAAGFADQIVRLYQSEEDLSRLSRQGVDLLAEHFTERAAQQRMAEVLNTSLESAEARLADANPVAEEYAPPRLIAFYLPQFHPIPENDQWWGEGFTDWRNVTAAKPLLSRHHQPHVPSELGYYDLREEDVRVRQAGLARAFGIEGFCYYHYWFNGKWLLERPLEAVLSSGKPDFPFCICWANENWTRRWDGMGKDLLIEQHYSPEDDREHIRALFPYLNDPRYIRVHGKPLLLIYRTEVMPDPVQTARIWREEARLAGIGEIYLCRVESFATIDPRQIGFDAAVEFAPDWANSGPQLRPDSPVLAKQGPDIEEVCKAHKLFDYKGLSDTMMAKRSPEYRWFRCVTPGFDNTARRRKDAKIFLDSSPENYQTWLSRAIRYTEERLRGEERLVFVNAWNEWAEGNHLEPDRKFGRAYLEATAKALEAQREAFENSRGDAHGIASVGQLAAELATSKERERVLKTRLEEKDQRIQELLNSTSWRLTRPVRWIKERLRGRKPG